MTGRTRAKRPEAKDTVRTTVELPTELWQAARIRAAKDRSDLRAVVVAALTAYLKRKRGEGE